MNRQTLVVPVEWKAADDEDENTLVGYASTFGNVDLQYDTMQKGAFKNSLPRVVKGEVPYLADHVASVRNVIGTLTEAEEDNRGLKIKVKFATDADSQAIRQKMIDGHVRKMSIGYEPLQWRYETRGQNRVRVLEDVRLWEVSAVVFPANPQAVIQTVKSAVAEAIDTVVAGAVAAGGDEVELKALIASWGAQSPNPAGGLAPSDSTDEPGTAPGTLVTKTTTPHLDTDAGADGGAELKTDTDPGSLTLLMHKADAVLAGRDPDATADPVKLAGVDARLEALDTFLQRHTRAEELADELAALRGDR
ncbi:HK97 family phage prohead protease [Nocardiopsis tropica]|uniref:HK97 family phage prohead protease n=1 Tax=Nocardiopsis tropica TaxID=109330 RepID=UPI002E8B4547|nr:HK97 family phage prohead protease [Nocardiopsis tropica]